MIVAMAKVETYGFAPHDWHSVVEQTLGHFFERLREHHETFHRFEQFLQRAMDDIQQFVVSREQDHR